MPSAPASAPASAASPTSRRCAERHAAMVAELCRLIETAEQPPTLDELAQRARLSPYHLHRVFKADHRPDAQGPMRRRIARSACGDELEPQRHGDRGDLRRRLQLQRPLLRRGRRGARHDADATTAPAAPTPRSASPSASARSARSSSRAASAASARSRWATTPTRWRAICRTAFRSADLIGGDAEFERLVANGRRLRRGAAPRPRPAARRARHRVPAARLAGAARDPGRARPRATPRSPSASARRTRCAPWRRPAPRTRWRSRSRAIASCAATARCRAIAGASSASARCSAREAQA